MENKKSNEYKETVHNFQDVHIVKPENIGTMAGWGWQRGWSHRSQRYFWYNKSKNISVWELQDILKLSS